MLNNYPFLINLLKDHSLAQKMNKFKCFDDAFHQLPPFLTHSGSWLITDNLQHQPKLPLIRGEWNVSPRKGKYLKSLIPFYSLNEVQKMEIVRFVIFLLWEDSCGKDFTVVCFTSVPYSIKQLISLLNKVTHLPPFSATAWLFNVLMLEPRAGILMCNSSFSGEKKVGYTLTFLFYDTFFKREARVKITPQLLPMINSLSGTWTLIIPFSPQRLWSPFASLVPPRLENMHNAYVSEKKTRLDVSMNQSYATNVFTRNKTYMEGSLVLSHKVVYNRGDIFCDKGEEIARLQAMLSNREFRINSHLNRLAGYLKIPFIKTVLSKPIQTKKKKENIGEAAEGSYKNIVAYSIYANLQVGKLIKLPILFDSRYRLNMMTMPLNPQHVRMARAIISDSLNVFELWGVFKKELAKIPENERNVLWFYTKVIRSEKDRSKFVTFLRKITPSLAVNTFSEDVMSFSFFKINAIFSFLLAFAYKVLGTKVEPEDAWKLAVDQCEIIKNSMLIEGDLASYLTESQLSSPKTCIEKIDLVESMYNLYTSGCLPEGYVYQDASANAFEIGCIEHGVSDENTWMLAKLSKNCRKSSESIYTNLHSFILITLDLIEKYEENGGEITTWLQEGDVELSVTQFLQKVKEKISLEMTKYVGMPYKYGLTDEGLLNTLREYLLPEFSRQETVVIWRILKDILKIYDLLRGFKRAVLLAASNSYPKDKWDIEINSFGFPLFPYVSTVKSKIGRLRTETRELEKALALLNNNDITSYWVVRLREIGVDIANDTLGTAILKVVHLITYFNLQLEVMNLNPPIHDKTEKVSLRGIKGERELNERFEQTKKNRAFFKRKYPKIETLIERRVELPIYNQGVKIDKFKLIFSSPSAIQDDTKMSLKRPVDATHAHDAGVLLFYYTNWDLPSISIHDAIGGSIYLTPLIRYAFLHSFREEAKKMISDDVITTWIGKSVEKKNDLAVSIHLYLNRNEFSLKKIEDRCIEGKQSFFVSVRKVERLLCDSMNTENDLKAFLSQHQEDMRNAAIRLKDVYKWDYAFNF